MMNNTLRQLYALTIGALLNAISTRLPTAMDRATTLFAKSERLLDTAVAAADRRISTERSLRTALKSAHDASLARSDDAFDDKARAERVRQRIRALLA